MSLLWETHVPACPRRPLSDPTSVSFSLPPLFSRPIPNQTLHTHRIILPVQIRNVHIQWAVQPRVTQQLLYRTHSATQSVTRGPMLGRQQCETDLAGLKMYVRMTYRRDKLYFRRCKRIVLWDVEGQQPEAAGVWRGLVSGTFEDGFPAEEVFVTGGAEVKDCVVWRVAKVGDLVCEAFERGRAAGFAGKAVAGAFGGAPRHVEGKI